MNKLTSIFWALLILFCGCSSFEESVTETINEDLKDLYASFEEDTRTYVENNKYLCWHEDDRLTIFYGNTLNRQYKFNGAAGDNSGPFSFVPSEELGADKAFNKIYALYPYNPDVCITEEGVITLTLPAEQTYAENSFGRGANTMLAVTENLEDTSLSFKNTCGYLKLKLYNSKGVTIKSIEVKGNKDEKIAGTTTATIVFGELPELTLSDDASTSVTLNCGKGVTLGTTAETATEFWIVLPVTTFAEGLTITATATDGKIFEKSTTNEVVIERNVIQPMAALEVNPEVPKNAKILYTSSDGKVVTPYNAIDFGATIISNTYIDGKGVITFDGDVTMIGNNAFYEKKTLTGITLPNSVTTIGEKAFYNCRSLTNVTIGDSVTSIGESAFYGTRLTSVNITDVAAWCDISFDGYYANPLYSADNLYVNEELITDLVIPDGVTTIGNYAFYDCSTLTKVTISDSVTTIGDSAFADCTSLTNVTIGDSVTTIGSLAFWGCSSLTSITIPNNVNTIGTKAFLSCSGLTSLTLGNGLTSIGESAFRNCKSLTNVNISDRVTTIGEGAFAYCSSLTSVTIPDNLATIGSNVFCNCTNLQEFKGKFASYDGRCLIIDGVLNSFAPYDLTEYSIPDGVTSIGDYAFENCTSLTYISIPESVTSIGIYAFSGCKCLSKVLCYATVPPSLGSCAFDNNANGRKIFVYEESVKPYKSAWAHYESSIYNEGGSCAYVTKINYTTKDGLIVTSSRLPIVRNIYENGVGTMYVSGKQISIPNSAFHGCKSLTSITIPNNVTTIGDFAFADCTSLTNVTIGDSVTTIGSDAFTGCSSLTSITIPNNVTAIGNFAFGGCSTLTSITIGDSVTTIGSHAFSGCSSLTSITIPNNVNTIGTKAFLSCSGLTSLTLGNGLTSIGESAFQNCKSLTNVNITDVAAWCNISIYDDTASPFYYGAAYGTANLYVNGELVTDLVIPDGATTIGRNAFTYCNSLTSVTIPDSVTTIGEYAFWACSSLTNVTIGDSVTTIGDGAFSYCNSLTSVTIPDSVTTMDYAFQSCSSLTNVTIGDSVTTMNGTFTNCSSLTSVYCKAITPPSLSDITFSKSTTGRKIYVPHDSVNAYMSAQGWKEYAGDIVGYDF